MRDMVLSAGNCTKGLARSTLSGGLQTIEGHLLLGAVLWAAASVCFPTRAASDARARDSRDFRCGHPSDVATLAVATDSANMFGRISFAAITPTYLQAEQLGDAFGLSCASDFLLAFAVGAQILAVVDFKAGDSSDIRGT